MAYFMIPPVDNTAPCRIRFNAVDYGSDTTEKTSPYSSLNSSRETPS